MSVAAVLLSSCTTTTSITSTTKLRPPVITETFTRLACSQSSTVGMEGCAEAQLLKGDALLNREVHLLFTLLPTKSQQRSFVRAEKAWLAFRAADCQSTADVYQRGTFEPVAYGQCEVNDDLARSSSLHSYFLTLEQGSSPVPTWP